MAEALHNLDLVAATLGARLADPLPGVEAQLRMSPRPRPGWEPEVFPSTCRRAAVLVLLYPWDSAVRVLLTQRRLDLPDHPGQVSLPGGEVEGDETLHEAALREAEEEVGVDPEAVSILGDLTPLHVPVSNFILYPVAGTTDARPALQAAEDEVARILEPALGDLADPDTQVLRPERGRHDLPFFQVEDLEVWGATAMVLAELLAVLGAAPDPWGEAAGGQWYPLAAAPE